MITTKDVKYIASLSRLHLKEDEIGLLTKNLEDILHYIAKLKKTDVSKIAPTTHALPLKNVYREDKIVPSLTQKEALSISVEKHKGAFKVPKIIE